MNKPSRMLLALAALCPGPLTAAPEPPDDSSLSRASVTIPYTELRALWESAKSRKVEEKPAPSPVAHLVHRADLQLRLSETASALDATFDIEAIDANWQTIPLLGGDARLDKVEAGARQVIWKDGYSLLTNEPGKSSVALHLTAGDARRGLRLRLGSATIKRLHVSGIPAGMDVRVNGQTSGDAKDGTALFSLPSEAGEVAIELAAPRVEKPAQPSRWQAHSQVLVRCTEGVLRFQSRIFAHADDGSGLEITLAVPANASAITVTGDDLAGWTQTRAGDGRRLLHVKWTTADVLERELNVACVVPQSPLAEQWSLHAPAVPEEKDSRHLFAILPADGLELKGDALRAGVATQRLPEWMRSEIGGAAFVTAEGGPQLILQARWLPVIATAEAIVSEAKCHLRLIADGSMQTSAIYAIRHAAPLAWRLELPAGVELLSCNVAGQPARPIQREGGVIELSLPKPGEGAKGMTQVAFTYASKTQPFDPISGRAALELPRTPLFIERLDWTVAIPAAFEVTAFDGNVTVGDAPPDAQTIALRKDLCRAERPTVELFYQRREK